MAGSAGQGGSGNAGQGGTAGGQPEAGQAGTSSGGSAQAGAPGAGGVGPGGAMAAGGLGGSAGQKAGAAGQGPGGSGGAAGQGSSGVGGEGGASVGLPFQGPQIVGGANFFGVLLTDARIKCWGAGYHGQLGLGEQQDRGDKPGEMGADLPAVDLGMGASPVALTTTNGSVCALLEDGRVKCWGGNDSAELGLGDNLTRGAHPGEMGNLLPFVQLGGRAVQLSGGSGHVCALLEDGRVKCWGSNLAGQLALASFYFYGDSPGQMGDALPAVNLGSVPPIRSLAAGYWHTCALFVDGRLKCWGLGGNGQLGLGDNLDHGKQGGMGDDLPFVDLGTNQKAVALTAGLSHTCALLDDGQVKCWGKSTSLGLGFIADNLGDSPGEMGDALYFVQLGAGLKPVTLQTRQSHTCALLTGGQLKCWGENGFGQVGSSSSAVVGISPDDTGDKLPFVPLGSGVTAIGVAVSEASTCALLKGDRVKCWGHNDQGQLGLGDEQDRGLVPAQMGDALPFVDLGVSP